ncbi:olfactory receptor 14I1-like [Gopherus flavomarginatus]|uniref:olfactory receptor 14I1-like n=1 Tax=Gopherus flavomarginatus TaxID=286002 RepID=UPI0021CB9C99|nr:olfactory receptor 14I1-like [Gopherus flavomarginatus]
MSNQITVTEFLLLGFSDIRELQILHFMVFLGIYLVALTGNLLIIKAIALDHHLHTPMYFFLMNLSILDLGCISIVDPKSMANSLMNTKVISYHGCIIQVFFFLFFTTAEPLLLIIMAYDWYIAICQPLHYKSMINRRACVQMAASIWISGVLNSALHTGNTFAIIFWADNEMEQFFCETLLLLKLASYDSYLRETGAIAFSMYFALNYFFKYIYKILSYILILKTVLRIPFEQGQHKIFSTCILDLIVVSVFLCTASFTYIKPTFSSVSALNLIVAVLYSVVPPMMNPIIYSMRNKDIKAALWKMIGSRQFSKKIKWPSYSYDHLLILCFFINIINF